MMAASDCGCLVTVIVCVFFVIRRGGVHLILGPSFACEPSAFVFFSLLLIPVFLFVCF